MVAHDAVTADPHIDPQATFGEYPLERLEISSLSEDAQSPIRPVEDVVDIAAQRNAFRSSHAPFLQKSGKDVKFYRLPILPKKYRTPFSGCTGYAF